MKITFLTRLGLLSCLVYNLNAATLAENLQRDSDGDKISDAVEISLGLNPLDKTDGVRDTDQDGLSLADEVNAGTNPNKADSDDDGINDFDERENTTVATSGVTRSLQTNRPTPPLALTQITH
jgi:hypothetical protein